MAKREWVAGVKDVAKLIAKPVTDKVKDTLEHSPRLKKLTSKVERLTKRTKAKAAPNAPMATPSAQLPKARRVLEEVLSEKRGSRARPSTAAAKRVSAPKRKQQFKVKRGQKH
jgi:hypothetical protein